MCIEKGFVISRTPKWIEPLIPFSSLLTSLSFSLSLFQLI
jgi:hypothetical protein